MIRKEASVFLIVGILTVIVDFLVYKTLLWRGVNYNSAKAVGFIIGTIFAYFANKNWTFGHIDKCAQGQIIRFASLYGLTLGANVIVNHILLSLLKEYVMCVQLAFLFATAVSATLNFIGMKFFVFKTTNPRINGRP